MRLRQELAAACRAARLNAWHIARVSNEMTALEREMALPLRPRRSTTLQSQPLAGRQDGVEAL
ncbi:MAG TPA: hypothetical protein VHM00_04510 [Caldimonas sp.]|nr:hypothetical protein [Caldimonas sp.]HEX2540327.1 hypothetical protein [Caldimonas sp.]